MSQRYNQAQFPQVPIPPHCKVTRMLSHSGCSSHLGSLQQLPVCDIYRLMLCCLVSQLAETLGRHCCRLFDWQASGPGERPWGWGALPPRQRNGSVHACITQRVLFLCCFSSCVRRTGRRGFAIRQWEENLSKCAERNEGGERERERARMTLCHIHVGHIQNSRKR